MANPYTNGLSKEIEISHYQVERGPFTTTWVNSANNPLHKIRLKLFFGLPFLMDWTLRLRNKLEINSPITSNSHLLVKKLRFMDSNVSMVSNTISIIFSDEGG